MRFYLARFIFAPVETAIIRNKTGGMLAFNRYSSHYFFFAIFSHSAASHLSDPNQIANCILVPDNISAHVSYGGRLLNTYTH